MIRRKIITIIIFLSLVNGIFVYNTNQVQSASALLYFTKEFIIYPLVRQLANALENKLVNKVNSLLSGVAQGTPSFILNWRNHTLDSQSRGNDVFRSILADAKLCPYLQDNLQRAFGAEKYIGLLKNSIVRNSAGQVVYQSKINIPGLPSFQNLSNCTMPANFNLQTFKNDFNAGGWEAWNRLIQPQNNFLGAYTLALAEQEFQQKTEKESAENEAIAGAGYLAQKLGVKEAVTGPSGCTGAFGSGQSRCMFMGKTITPAKLLGEANARSLDKKLGRIGGSTQITDIILSLASAVLTGVTNNLLNFIGQNTYDRPASPANFVEGIYDPNSAPAPIPISDTNLGDPNQVQANACNAEYDSCIANTTICQPGPIDPVTGNPEPDVCITDTTSCDIERQNCANL